MVGSLIAASVFGLTAGTFAYVATAFVVNYALSQVVIRTFGQKPSQGQVTDPGMRQQIPPNTGNPLPIVYGDAYLGGTFVDAALTTDQKTMYYVMAVSCISPNGTFNFDTTKFYYGDRLITFDSTDQTKVVSLTDDAGNVDTTINGYLYINLYTSTNAGVITNKNGTAAPSTVMGASSGLDASLRWTGTRQMNGLAFAIVKLVYSREANTTQLQPITYYCSQYLNGQSCARPGDVWYDYITNPDYGGAIDSAYVNAASRTALNTYSDQTITFTNSSGNPATQPRYRINGVLNGGETVLTNIDRILECCDSWMTYNAATGQWAIVVNKAETPAYSFNDQNIIGELRVSATDITSQVNQVEAQFPFKDNRDQSAFVFLETPSGLLLPNEPVNKYTTTFYLCNDSVQASYLANRILEQAREDLIVSFNTTYYGIQVDAGDVIYLTNSSYNWTNKPFRVVKVNEVSLADGSLGARIECTEYSAAVYDDQSITQYSPVPNSYIPSPTYWSALSAPTVTGYPSATVPNFSVQVFIPTVGRTTLLQLFYTTSATPSSSDWKLLTTANISNSTAFTNNTYYTFTDLVLAAGTYYFAYNCVNNASQSLLSSASTAFTWSPTGGIGPTGPTGSSGDQYAAVYLYQWASSSAPSDPSGQSTWTWATGSNSNYTGGGGWSVTVPANPGTAGLQLWVASKQVSAPANTSTTTVSWASGFIKYSTTQNGAAGTPGLQIAKPTVYQWALSTPSISGTSTYTWATGEFTAPSGWSTTITTSPSPGYILYSAYVNVQDSAGVTSTSFSWTGASIVTAGYAGTAGTAGSSARIMYARIAGNPVPVTGTVTVTGDNRPTGTQSSAVWGASFNITWYANDPDPSSNNSLYQADGIYNGTNTAWSTPYISSLKVGELSAVSTNTGSLTVSGTLQAGTAAISGTTMTGAGGVIYSSGNFAFGNSTTNMTFNGTSLVINGLQEQSLSQIAGGYIGNGNATINLLTFTITSQNANKNALIFANGTFFASNSVGNNLIWVYPTTHYYQIFNTFRIVDSSNVIYYNQYNYQPSIAIPLSTGEKSCVYPVSFFAMIQLPVGTYTVQLNSLAQAKDYYTTFLGNADTYFDRVSTGIYIARL